jgi:hypothetical protein
MYIYIDDWKYILWSKKAAEECEADRASTI